MRKIPRRDFEQAQSLLDPPPLDDVNIIRDNDAVSFLSNCYSAHNEPLKNSNSAFHPKNPPQPTNPSSFPPRPAHARRGRTALVRSHKVRLGGKFSMNY